MSTSRNLDHVSSATLLFIDFFLSIKSFSNQPKEEILLFVIQLYSLSDLSRTYSLIFRLT